MSNMEKVIKDICDDFKNEFSDKKRLYKEIIDGEETYVEGYPPKKVGIRYVSIPHGLIEVTNIRIGFKELEVTCKTVK